MTDKFSKEVRSRIMSRIKGKDTKPEILLRKRLYSMGFRYRTNMWLKFGKVRFRPDIIFISKKVAIFVDGCFWHKCPKCYKEPKSNRDYWLNKIETNTQRDKRQNILLENEGWEVLRFWEHDINDNIDNIVNIISEVLNSKDR